MKKGPRAVSAESCSNVVGELVPVVHAVHFPISVRLRRRRLLAQKGRRCSKSRKNAARRNKIILIAPETRSGRSAEAHAAHRERIEEPPVALLPKWCAFTLQEKRRRGRARAEKYPQFQVHGRKRSVGTGALVKPNENSFPRMKPAAGNHGIVGGDPGKVSARPSAPRGPPRRNY